MTTAARKLERRGNFMFWVSMGSGNLMCQKVRAALAFLFGNCGVDFLFVFAVEPAGGAAFYLAGSFFLFEIEILVSHSAAGGAGGSLVGLDGLVFIDAFEVAKRFEALNVFLGFFELAGGFGVGVLLDLQKILGFGVGVFLRLGGLLELVELGFEIVFLGL